MAKAKPKAGSFEDRWLRRQRECAQDGLGRPAFLKYGDATLPSKAAPFVSFEQAEDRPRIWEVFGAKEKWSASEKKRVGGYRMIGSDGCGNPICVEDGTGVVWMLDHEDYFRTRQFVNSSVHLLAECLLACMGERRPSRLLGAIEKLESPAAAKNSFWAEAAQNLGSVEAAE
jgi:SUKH-4 immunity protein